MLGLPEAVITSMLKRSSRDNEAFTLWPQNLAAVKAFLAAATQWRVMPLGLAGSQLIGLDYGAVAVVTAAEGIHLGAADWLRLRVMEAAALEVINRGARG